MHINWDAAHTQRQMHKPPRVVKYRAYCHYPYMLLHTSIAMKLTSERTDPTIFSSATNPIILPCISISQFRCMTTRRAYLPQRPIYISFHVLELKWGEHVMAKGVRIVRQGQICTSRNVQELNGSCQDSTNAGASARVEGQLRAICHLMSKLSSRSSWVKGR